MAKKTTLQNGVVKYEGRQGESTEYVEFDPRRTNRVRFVAQQAGSVWFVFEVFPGPKGAVRTMGQYQNREDAAHAAYNLASA